MRLFFTLILPLLLYTSFGYTQKQTDTLQAYRYYQKADSLLADYKLDPAIEYFEKARVIYEKAKAWERVASCYNRVLEGSRVNGTYFKTSSISNDVLRICNTYLHENDIEKAKVYYHLGYISVRKFDSKSALDYYLHAYNILEINNYTDHWLHIKLLCQLGQIYNKTNKSYALTTLEKALNISLKEFGEDSRKTAYVYTYFAFYFKQNANYDQALVYYQKDLNITIQSKGANFYEVAGIHSNVGIIYKILCDYKQSENHFLKAISIYQQNHGVGTDLSITYNSMGVLQRIQGNYVKALDYYQKALKIHKIVSTNNYKSLSILYNNIGVVFENKKAYKKAISYYQKALNLNLKFNAETHNGTAKIYNNLSFIYKELKQFKTALLYANKALSIRSHLSGEAYNDITESYNYIGHIYLDQGDLKSALIHYQNAHNVLLKAFGKQHSRTAKNLNYIAKVYFLQNHLKKAIDFYQQGITSNRKPHNFIDYSEEDFQNILDPKILLTSYLGQAKSYIALYNNNPDLLLLQKCMTLLHKADAVIHNFRQSLSSYQDKVFFAQQAKEIYSLAVKTGILTYRTTNDITHLHKTFQYAEKSKASTLKDLLNESDAKNFAGLPKEILEREQTLKTDNAFYQSQITNELSRPKNDSSKIATYENKLFDISRSQDSLAQVIEKNYPKYHQLTYIDSIISVTAIQQQIADQTTLLEFFTSDSITYAFTLSKNKLHVKKLSTPDLETTINSFKEAITSKNNIDYRQLGHQLYALLIEPVAEDLVGNELIIIPDGPLWHLNFELLLTDNTSSNNPKDFSYLLKEYAISYANSANLLFNSFTTPKSKNQKLQECLAFSFSDSRNVVDSKEMSLATLRDAGDDLPGTRAEIKAISDIIDGQYFYGSEAVESNFKKNASNYNILHLALHGEVDNERPENSKLYFTKSKDTLEDNFLYSHELFALDIPAELTVLSACNTGTGKIAKGEGIMSLGNAFQYAGTKSLLLSSWEVSDQTTPELMQNFYRNLKEGMNKSKALQQAKLQYLQNSNPQRSGPFYWGGFYLVGDASPMTFSSPGYWYWIVIGGLGVFILMTVILLWSKQKNSKKLKLF